MDYRDFDPRTDRRVAERRAPAKPGLWIPVTDRVDLAHLGKLGEETGELSAVVSRCIIQGLDGIEPGTGKINRVWLAEEIADVSAMSHMVVDRFGLDRGGIYERAARKMAFKTEWHRMLRESQS